MVPLRDDPEKDNYPSSNPSTHLSHLIDDPEKDEHATTTTGTSPSHTAHSNVSRDTIDSDPLSPLEHALTPDLETDAEHLARPELTYTKTGA